MYFNLSGLQENEVIRFDGSLFQTYVEKKAPCIREGIKKKYGIIWEFFPNVGPPPPFWEPLVQKKKMVKIWKF